MNSSAAYFLAFHSSYSLVMVAATVKPQAKIGKSLNFSGTA